MIPWCNSWKIHLVNPKIRTSIQIPATGPGGCVLYCALKADLFSMHPYLTTVHMWMILANVMLRCEPLSTLGM
uniref:Uncharacterized protein n=1 Tax=Anguilla anguilla TaxID=7936 RepID=A0A0E9XXG7_ANGAN